MTEWIRSLINWMNDNEGFLMVVITFVYVIATIFICIFNGKSAKASREQVKEAQKQQEQNTALQLYSMRKDTIEKLMQRKINEIFLDVSLLYSSDIFDSFSNIASHYDKFEKMEQSFDEFENYASLFLSMDDHLNTAREDYVYSGHSDAFGLWIKHLDNAFNGEAKQQLDQYKSKVDEVKSLNYEINLEILNLSNKMREYVRKSIM